MIPILAQVERAEGEFKFSAQTGIRYNSALATEAEFFAKDLEKLTGEQPMMATKKQRSFPSAPTREVACHGCLKLVPAHTGTTRAGGHLTGAGEGFRFGLRK